MCGEKVVVVAAGVEAGAWARGWKVVVEAAGVEAGAWAGGGKVVVVAAGARGSKIKSRKIRIYTLLRRIPNVFHRMF